MNIIPILLLALPLVAKAADYPFDKAVNLGQLHKEIVEAGITHGGVMCGDLKSATKCRVINPSSNPVAVIAAHVPTDEKAARTAKLDATKALVSKLRDGKAAPGEKDQILLMICQMLGLIDR